MDTQLSTRRMMLILKLLKQLGALHLKKKKNVTVFAEDTDIFTLLLYFRNIGMGETFKKANKRKSQIQSWSV